MTPPVPPPMPPQQQPKPPPSKFKVKDKQWEAPQPNDKSDPSRVIRNAQASLMAVNIIGGLQSSIAEKLHQEGNPSHSRKTKASSGSQGDDEKAEINARDLTPGLQSGPSGWTHEQVHAHTDMVMQNMIDLAAVTSRAAEQVFAPGATQTSPSLFVGPPAPPTVVSTPTTAGSGTKSETAVQAHVRAIVEGKGYKISNIEPLIMISGKTGCYVTATPMGSRTKEERFFVPVDLHKIIASNPEDKIPNLISKASLPDDVAAQFNGRSLSALYNNDVWDLAIALDNRDYFNIVGSPPGDQYKIWFQHNEGRIILVPYKEDGTTDYPNAKSYTITDAKGPLKGYDLVRAGLKFIEIRPKITATVASVTISKGETGYKISLSSGITLNPHATDPELWNPSGDSKEKENIRKDTMTPHFEALERWEKMESKHLHKYLKGLKGARFGAENNPTYVNVGDEAVSAPFSPTTGRESPIYASLTPRSRSDSVNSTDGFFKPKTDPLYVDVRGEPDESIYGESPTPPE